MNWLDVCGPPGSGKSTLCDPIWGPHDIEFDGRNPPEAWHDFLNETSRLLTLLGKLQGHDNRDFIAAVRMTRRTMRKMATVARNVRNCDYVGSGEEGLLPYIQTGFAQRGLGYGRRLVDVKADVNEIRHFFRLMPVSIGVAIASADVATIVARNQKRATVAETAHENREAMVEPMQPAIAVMREVLAERGVPVIDIDTTKPIDDARAELVAFSQREPFACIDASRPDLSAPVWW